MMMNRERLGFWVRLVAILLSVFFIGSFIFMGLGTNVSYNLFDLIGGSDQQPGGQTTDPQEQIEQAEKELEENPRDPEAIKELAALYYQNGQLEDAARVLENGREAAPKDAESPRGLRRCRADRTRQRGRVPAGRRGLRPGRRARPGHKVLQRLP